MSEQDLCASVMYPQVFDEYEEFKKEYGDVSGLPTPNYFLGMEEGEEITLVLAGREVTIKYLAQSQVFQDGTRDVFFEVHGLPRKVNVVDKTASKDVIKNLRADASNKKHVGAPMPG